MSPTFCYQFDDEYPNEDGADYVNVIHSDFNETMYRWNGIGAVHIIDDELVDASKLSRCFESNLCFIECTHCSPSAVIVPPQNSTVRELVINCKEKMSCNDLTVDVQETMVDTVHIECGANETCSGATFSIESTSSTQFTLNCDAKESCKDVTVNLLHSENGTEMMATYNESETFLSANISCFEPYSCHEMEINTNHNRNIRLTLNAYRWSEAIHIHHEHWDDINVNCGNSEDRRYVKYPTSLLSDSNFERLARAEYADSQSRLPCEDIVIHCGNRSHPNRQCEFEYNLDVSISDILDRGDNATCYWMDIYHLYHAECIGECNYPISINYTNRMFQYDLDLVIKGNDDMRRTLMSTEGDDDAGTNWTVSYILCNESFGDENKTAKTLNTVNTIFEDVLHFMMESGSLVHSIQTPPNTALPFGDVECQNEDNNTIQIQTSFEIVAIEEDDCDSIKVNEIFASDGTFLDRSSKLTEDLLGATIIYDVLNVNDVDMFKVGMKTSQVVAISGAVAAFALLISYLFYRIRRVMRSTVMHNPLVIMIPIGDYDAIHGYINLPVKNDLVNVMKLFGEQLGYDVYPQYGQAQLLGQADSVKLHWTRDQIIDLLEEKAKFLVEHRHIHDGLVVVISCHGINGSIISSDGQHIPKLLIHRIFSMGPDTAALRVIPRLFVFDCCDGNFDRDQCNREMMDQAKGSGDTLSVLHTVTAVNARWRNDSNPWAKDERNPDYKLAVVHAANESFSSVARKDVGSYLIFFMVSKLARNVGTWAMCRGRRFLSEVVDEIQAVLEEKGKQLVVPVYLNGTERIVFRKHRVSLHFAETRESAQDSQDVTEEVGPALEMVASNSEFMTPKQLSLAEGGRANETQNVVHLGVSQSL